MHDPAEQAARERLDATSKFVDEVPDDHRWTLTGAEAKAMFADFLTRERAARDEGRQEAQEITYQTMKAQMEVKVERARLEEREACAKLVESIAPTEYVQRIADTLRRAPAGDSKGQSTKKCPPHTYPWDSLRCTDCGEVYVYPPVVVTKNPAGDASRSEEGEG